MSTRKSKRVAAALKDASKASDSPKPPAKAAKTDKAATTDKSAWNALFAPKSSQLSRPKPSSGISKELQDKVAAYPQFEGVPSNSKSDPKNWKIVAWNVNGLRAMLKKEAGAHIRAYVKQEDPDVFCIGETKICSDELKKIEDFLPDYKHQYWSCATKKGYSGTAVFSKTEPLTVKHELLVSDQVQDEGRFLALEYPKFWLVHTYVPNSGAGLVRLDYRTKEWDVSLFSMLQELEKSKPVVFGGDLNVAHEEIDIHDPVSNRNKSAGFTDAERESFGGLLSKGFVDTYRHFHPDTKQFSYFSYRFKAREKNKGWRLDYFVTSKSLLPHVESAFIRGLVTGSDHVPIGIELKDL